VAWLFARMEERRACTALIWNDESSSFGDLLERASRWRTELAGRGVGAGSVVLVEAVFSPGAVSLLLALIQLRAIAVPLTPASRVQRARFAEIAEAGFCVEFDASDAWTLSLPGRSASNALTLKLAGRGHPGLVIFSSGSTGEPKAVLHDFVALLEKFKARGQGKRILTFLLFDHIGGMDTLFNVLANGGTMVTTPSRDPDAVCRAIAAHRVHTLPASPTFLNLLLISEAWRQHDVSSLRVVAYGTESMPEQLLARLREALPGVQLVQTYGLSELGVLRTRSREDGSLWLRFRGEGFETKVVDGLLWVRTASAMLGYLNAPNLFDEAGWLNTEDAVVVEGEYLRILGRASEIINVGGRKVYPAEVENVISQLDNVRDVAVYGEKNSLTGQIVAARINLVVEEPLEGFKRRLRVFCRQRLAAYKIPARIELTDREQYGERLKKLRRPVVAASEGPQ
jgi:acyl-CoA synthetase (AMP-forming)/AMP-acid ligase II